MNTITLLPFLAAAAHDLTPFLIRLVVILIICGIVAFIVTKAPFIAEPWKSVITWVLIAIPAIYVVMYLLTFL